MLFFAVALEDFFLAAFFVAFFAAFFAAFFFAMIQSLLQEKNLGDRFDRWLAHRAKRIGLNESLPRILSSLPTVASCALLLCAGMSFALVAAAISSRTLDIPHHT